MTRNQFFITLAAIAIIAAAVAVYFLWTPGSSSDAITATGSGTPVTLQPDDRTMGNPKAKVLVVEYAAPSCPHCAHFDETI
ncbi:MAG TPA: thioredoxin domain-containing protein, partial [Rhizomicrobium sp.]|nr:thioredoxin domain-containing protein [Rhizomicrobium sp.]